MPALPDINPARSRWPKPTTASPTAWPCWAAWSRDAGPGGRQGGRPLFQCGSAADVRRLCCPALHRRPATPHAGAHADAKARFRISSHLRDVCNALVMAFSSDQQRVQIEHHGADCLILTKYVQPLTLIVCEILTNAMKYAHPAGVPVRMVVSCNYMSDGALQVRVSDDGVGLPEGFDPAKDGGIGFQIIRALAAEIGAELAVTLRQSGRHLHDLDGAVGPGRQRQKRLTPPRTATLRPGRSGFRNGVERAIVADCAPFLLALRPATLVGIRRDD